PNICTDESSFVVTINASPILTLINTSCSTDLLTYSVSFSVSSNSAVITSSAGTVGSGNITDIPVGTDITITASNSVNTFCDTVLNVTAPNCACIFVDEPISPNNPIVCEGSSTPNLTVAIPGLPAVGNQINWYDTPVGGSLLQSNSLTYLPTGTFIPGTTYTYYAEAEESVTGCVSSRIAVTLTWVTSIVAETAVDVSICGSYILPALSQNNTYYTASGGPNGTGVAISDFTEITASSTLFIYAEAGTSPNTCTDESSFNIIIQDGAQANLDMVPIVYQLCDDALDGDGNTTNDSVQFDLITQNTDILDGQSVANFSVTYYLNQTDANAGLNPLPLIYENISNPQIIYVRVDNDTMADDGSGTGAMVDTSLCYDIATLTLQVNPLADFELDATYLLCVNTNGTEVISSPIIDTGLNTTDYTFEWLLENVTIPGASGNTLEPLVGGNYSVIVTDIRTSTVTVCEASATTVVIESAPPAVAVEVLTEAFSDEQNIFVTTVGNGASEYEFSLDNGPWEINVPNNGTYTFTDVGAGDHIVTVRDRNGCGEASASVSIIGYPHVFTPNGDGYNDTWAIYGIGDQPDAVIYIFDRYGKLLKQFSPTSLGWDGTYNGNLMPTNDYWFTIDYMGADNNRKQFKAHFTLKR
ncbi:T9SS type B sorting domain-containing protein, partial [Olleya sp. 1-3]|uniref:T9SS type B sorting domain-containing protein n=1 Tax=Olleya sp. 1-3 TaxID=2058323 RepID=UPI001E4C14BF